MNYFYLKIFGLILFIFAVSYWNTYCSSFIESFSSNKISRAIVLLGDSILKNNSYVPDGKAVDNILEERSLKMIKILNYILLLKITQKLLMFILKLIKYLLILTINLLLFFSLQEEMISYLSM